MLGFQKLCKKMFSALKNGLERIPHCLGVVSNPHFFTIKSHTWYIFKTTQNSRGKHARFARNSESKREFFTKHFQVNIFLIGTFSSLDLIVLRFTN